MRILTIILTLLVISCKTNDKLESTAVDNWKDRWENPKSREQILLAPTIHKRIKDCLLDTSIVVLTKSLVSDSVRLFQIKNLGDINGDNVNDSIMVIPELYITSDSSYENGTSIIFSDARIPRITVDQECLAVDFVFVAGDIDEDGIMELGKYYTTCVSRFKSLELITLKKDRWDIFGAVTYDVWFEEPPKEQRIRKIIKNEFEMRELTDSSNVKVDRWIKFRLD